MAGIRFLIGRIRNRQVEFDGRKPFGMLKKIRSEVPGEFRMSLTEVYPEVQTLSRLDKIRLIQLLAQELERDEGGLIEPGRSYPVWSPDCAFSSVKYRTTSSVSTRLGGRTGNAPLLEVMTTPFSRVVCLTSE